MAPATAPAIDRIEKARDFHAWLLDQAKQLRLGDMRVDREGLAEELGAMAARERRELLSHLEVLLKHLLKWHYQPNRRGMSWRNSVKVARRGIEDLLEDSPSLKPLVAELIIKAYSRARTDAADDAKRNKVEPSKRVCEVRKAKLKWSDSITLNRTRAAELPLSCPWTSDQLINPDFWPTKRALKTTA
jgi:hypothetical protein